MSLMDDIKYVKHVGHDAPGFFMDEKNLGESVGAHDLLKLKIPDIIIPMPVVSAKRLNLLDDRVIRWTSSKDGIIAPVGENTDHVVVLLNRPHRPIHDRLLG